MWSSRFLLIFSFLFGAVMTVFYPDNRFGLTIIYSLITLSLLSIISRFFIKNNITIEESIAHTCVEKNEKITYNLKFKNKSPFLYPVIAPKYYNNNLINYGELDAGIGGLMPFSKINRVAAFTLPFRGKYDIGVENFQVTDFLGLFKITITPKRSLSVIVYPDYDKFFDPDNDNQFNLGGLVQDSFNEDYSSVDDVRIYAEGDSLKKIHWKLSAKRGEFYVKNFELFSPNKAIIFLDTNPLPYSQPEKSYFEDKMISFVASTISYFINEELPAFFIYGESEKKLEIDRNYRMSGILPLLAELKFEHSPKIKHLAEIPNVYCAFLFLSDMNDSIYKGVQTLLMSDQRVFVEYFYFESPTPEQENLLSHLESYGVIIRKNRLELPYKKDLHK